MIVALVGGAWLIGDRTGEDAEPPTTSTLPVGDLAPLAPAAGAASATWFCAGGTASPGSPADSVVDIVNEADEDAQGTVEIFPYPAKPELPSAIVPFAVGPRGRVAVRLQDAVPSNYAAALVEAQGGSVSVSLEVRGGSSGHDVAPCASRASSNWYFPWGQTIVGSTLRLSLFNPFPGDAVVDVTFETEDGFRSPESFQGVLVPAHRLVVLDVDAVVTRRQQVATRWSPAPAGWSPPACRRSPRPTARSTSTSRSVRPRPRSPGTSPMAGRTRPRSSGSSCSTRASRRPRSRSRS